MNVSVIIPTHNRPFMLERALISLCNSKLVDKEILVINDGSDAQFMKDYTNVYKAFENDIVVINSTQNRGVSAARNLGISQAMGEWILFLDDDDEILPGYIEFIDDYVSNASKQISVIWPNVMIKHYCNGKSVITRKMFFPASEEQVVSYFLSIGIGYGVVFRKEALIMVKCFDETLRVSEDTDLFFRFLQRKIIPVHIKVFGILIHQHECDKLTNSYRFQTQNHIFRSFFRKYNYYLKMNTNLYINYSNWINELYVQNSMLWSAFCFTNEVLRKNIMSKKVWINHIKKMLCNLKRSY
ncbi:MAG TPA: glycosyltransferase family 2 protein [Treponemataceae bacterium]|nr:glycosyltransferase family 2 protein [Treponemataceae bacterium]